MQNLKLSDLKPGHILKISRLKNEPDWMLEIRLQGLAAFHRLKIPSMGTNLDVIRELDITPYLENKFSKTDTWDGLPEKVEHTVSDLGLKANEKSDFAGTHIQWESQSAYEKLRQEWQDLGVIFCDTDTALQKYPDLIRTYFTKLVPIDDNKLAALNTALWSGGSFVYIPKDVELKQALQTYFRLNARKMGQFERSIIIADENSTVNYMEGCSAPEQSDLSLHAAVVQVYALKNSKVTYTTIQNWSKNVLNLVTKKGIAEQDASIRWLDYNFGSKITMKYPSIILNGDHAHGELTSLNIADKEQDQDTGATIEFNAPNCTGNILSKSISKNGGKSTFRGRMQANEEGINAKGHLICDNLVIDKNSVALSIPILRVYNDSSEITHEASIQKIKEEELTYLKERGIPSETAEKILSNSFLEPIIQELPLEYQIEVGRLLK